MNMKQSQITYWCHSIIRSQVKEGGFYIDATMGKGNDTLFLCQLAGEHGSVYAFDIQEAAFAAAEKLLESHGYGYIRHTAPACPEFSDSSVPLNSENSSLAQGNIYLIKDGHENMDRYFTPETADLVCFNFGYLPGGDHRIATKPQTSITAIEKGLKILKSGGMMSLCIYSGGDTGFAEKDAVLQYLKMLPAREYTVIVNEYYNRENCPPLPVFIFKR